MLWVVPTLLTAPTLEAGLAGPGPAASGGAVPRLLVTGFRLVKLNGSLPLKLPDPKGSLFGAELKLAVKLLPNGSRSAFPKLSLLIDLEFS